MLNILDIFNKTPQDVNQDIQKIVSESIPFGSRIWGGAKKNSDYDYIVDHSTYDVLVKLAKKTKLKYNCEIDDSYTHLPLGIDRMITMDVGDKTLQFTVPQKKIREDFIAAVKLTTHYVEENSVDMSTKKKRVKVFENFIDLVVDQKKYTQKFAQYNYLFEKYPEYLV